MGTSEAVGLAMVGSFSVTAKVQHEGHGAHNTRALEIHLQHTQLPTSTQTRGSVEGLGLRVMWTVTSRPWFSLCPIHAIAVCLAPRCVGDSRGQVTLGVDGHASSGVVTE